MSILESFRIVYIAASEYPSTAANSVQVVKQCNGMVQFGAQAILLARHQRRSQKTPDEIRWDYALDANVRLHLFEFSKWFPRLVSALLFPFWVVLNIPRDTNLLYARHALGLLVAGVMSSRSVDLVFECHGPPRLVASLALRVLCRLGRLNHVVAISQALKDILYKHYSYLQGMEIIVAHDGCDPLKQLLEPHGQLSVGYVGSFYRGRGIELIHNAAIQLPKVPFHLIGGDETAYINQVGVSPPSNVVCYGRINPVELPAYYSKFTIALAPYARKIAVADGTNTVDYMSPLKIFEYMGYGKAIIASDLPVLREILLDRVNSILVEPGQTKAWKLAIERLHDVNYRTLLSENARREALNRYTWAARAKLVILKC